ncbi:hypothetical protein [Pseudidiomarina aquimaris]|nr:hypothetical protein [Pseudidiomarina aquimaris]
MSSNKKITLFSSQLFYRVTLKYWKLWVAVPILLAFTFAGIRNLKPTEYEAIAVLAPSEERTGGLAEMAGALGGLAGLAGIDLGASRLNNTQMAVEIMKSRSFVYPLIRANNWLPYLLAVDEWDSEREQVIFEDNLYNKESQQWIRDVDPPLKPVPELWEGYEAFQGRFDVFYDRTTRIVTLRLRHESPEVAANWLNIIVREINEVMRQREATNVAAQIEYLNESIDNSQQTEVREALYQLLQEQYKRAMLVEVNEDYVFEFIDPPVVPHKPSSFSWKVWFVIGGFTGCLIMFTTSLLLSYRRVEQQIKY